MRFSVLLSVIFVFSASLFSATIRVPADQPTIQAGIDASNSGDTVLVADGTYTGDGNRDIDFGGKNIVLMSENGPNVTIIDCQGTGADPHRGFYFHNGEDSTAVVSGFTIKNGWARLFGGAMNCSFSSPTIDNCIIRANYANTGGAGFAFISSHSTVSDNQIIDNIAKGGEHFGGGGIYCHHGSSIKIVRNILRGNSADNGGGIFVFASFPIISDNTISENTATAGSGGGIYSFQSMFTVNDNSITDNTAVGDGINDVFGGGVYFYFNSNVTLSGNTISGNSVVRIGNSEANGGGIANNSGLVTISNSIIAFNSASDLGPAIWCNSATAVEISCSNVVGNYGGDWIGCIANQAAVNNNISLNPLFCDLPNGDYRVSEHSPCAPENNSCALLIGAFDVGCSYVCGDANGDGQVTYDDLDFMITYYFAFGPVPNPLTVSDLNVDGAVDLGDIMFLAEYLNGIGPAPCSGSDPPPFDDWKKEPEQIKVGTE